MNRIAVGVLVGGVLGILDGLTAWFTPEARPGIIGIVVGSTIKGCVESYWPTSNPMAFCSLTTNRPLTFWRRPSAPYSPALAQSVTPGLR